MNEPAPLTEPCEKCRQFKDNINILKSMSGAYESVKVIGLFQLEVRCAHGRTVALDLSREAAELFCRAFPDARAVPMLEER